jgi:hypothetical protein
VRHAGAMGSEAVRRNWNRLVDALDRWTEATVVAEGRVRVRLPGAATGGQEHVDIVMSPSDWDEWSSTVSGSFETAFEEVWAVVEMGEPHPFLVHDLYQLQPSMTETLPPDPDEERVAQLVRESHGRPIGNWVDYGKDGKMYPFPELPPR